MADPLKMIHAGIAVGAAKAIAGDVETGIASTGTTQTDAVALKCDVNMIASGASATGARLPSGSLGQEIYVANDTGNTIKIYPASGHTINVAAADAEISLPTAKSVTFKKVTGTKWASHPRVPS